VGVLEPDMVKNSLNITTRNSPPAEPGLDYDTSLGPTTSKGPTKQMGLQNILNIKFTVSCKIVMSFIVVGISGIRLHRSDANVPVNQQTVLKH